MYVRGAKSRAQLGSMLRGGTACTLSAAHLINGGLVKTNQRGFSALRQEMASMRVEMIRWSFLFWIGQLAGFVGLMAFMARATGRV